MRWRNLRLKLQFNRDGVPLIRTNFRAFVVDSKPLLVTSGNNLD